MPTETVQDGPSYQADVTWSLPLPLRRALMPTPPLALAVLEVFHPHPDFNVHAVLPLQPSGMLAQPPGWRGYARPVLLRRRSALAASTGAGCRVDAVPNVPLLVTSVIAWPELLIILVNSTVRRRIQALRDDGGAPAVAATGGARDRE